ncbi:MAG: hypothetical protein IT445_01860 [Phycisphaeraceae bacterium]|nr:hypothetical protein [Phycisphaeraceae bacterium]
MNQRATIARHYQVRLLIIGLLALLGGLYFLYDGMVGYPHEQAMYLEYQKVKEANPEDYNQRWIEFARERGWSQEVPEYKSDMDILTQKIIAGILIPIGVLILLRLLLNRGRWIAMDEQGLTDHAGRSVAFDAITHLDETRWQRKGIAVVHYKADGQDGRFVLDDWKFDRAAVSAMVKHLRALKGQETQVSQEA